MVRFDHLLVLLAVVALGQEAGWVRVLTGRPGERAERGALVYLTPATAVRDVSRDLLLPPHLTLWVQYGRGAASHRLRADDKPLVIQDRFLQRLGFADRSRRARLGIDPELRHLIRFHVGKSPTFYVENE